MRAATTNRRCGGNARRRRDCRDTRRPKTGLETDASGANAADSLMTDGLPFRATVSGLAGTHPLDLARQLAAHSVLAAYYTSLPESRTPGVPSALVRRHLALLLPIHGLIHGWMPMSSQRLARMIDHEFDRWASQRMIPADITHAVAGLGLRQRRAAKGRFDTLTVCDCGTTHIRYHQAAIDAEHARWNADPVQWDAKSVAGFEQ